jgi:uncharacterized MAPEG superfamily protein
LQYGPSYPNQGASMRSVVYIVGLVVIVAIVLALLGII